MPDRLSLRRLLQTAVCLVTLHTLAPSVAWAACGDGIVQPGEPCDPYDPDVPIEGADRYVLCNCDCTLRPRAMPLTLKMGLFYTVGGLLLFWMRGSFHRLRYRGSAILRMIAALALGPVLIVWGAMEWRGAVKPFLSSGHETMFKGKICQDLRPPGHK